MKNKNSKGLFDEALRLDKLTMQGDTLVLLKKNINWEQFRHCLMLCLRKKQKDQEAESHLIM